MTRKLASTRIISAINPIKDADRIELATLDGWQVVVGKNEFMVGELVVYLEIDSWVPHTLAPFLSKGKEPKIFEGIPGNRLRTVRLKGQLSQGLVLPLNVLPEGVYYEGNDVTDLLNIKLYEKPLPAQLAGTAKGNFPPFLQKTDQERIQNIANKLDSDAYLFDTWQITEKLDGSSMTVYHNNGEFGVCSRNIDLKETEDNSFWKVTRQLNLEEKLNTFGGNLALQGELVGPGIQKNPYNLPELRFYLFDVFDIDSQTYLLPDLVVAIARVMGIQHVPVMHIMAPTPPSVDLALNVANGESAITAGIKREGLVFKSNTCENSFKVISNEWLLSNE